MAAMAGGVTEFGGPGVGLGAPPPAKSGRTLRWRLGRAALLLVVAAATAGVAYAMAQESGVAALTGRPAVAQTSNCRGTRAQLCDAEVVARDGSVIDSHATVSSFARVGEGAEVRVRYRDGRAALDTLPERGAQVALLLFLAGTAVAALIGAAATLRGRPALRAAVVPLAAGPLIVVCLLGTLVVGAPTVAARDRPFPDIYAEVAAEPGRTLTSEGVSYGLVDNQPMSPAGCFGAPGCIAGAVAHWKVVGADLVATSHLLVFDGPRPAASAKEAITRNHALANAPAPPAGAVVVGIGSGRYAAAVWMSRADGSSPRDDPSWCRPSGASTTSTSTPPRSKPSGP
ncbi:MAG TPA: hypothetical protein VFE55_13680 [Acidimicrobiia bacterium]|nr:hypothetical protein [Acidimicrobiia bacterium]